MTEPELERKVLDFLFATDAQVTVASVAYYAGCDLVRAEAMLDKLCRGGTLRIENDADGHVYYEAPGRARLARPAAATQPQDVGAPSLMVVGGLPHAQRGLVPAPVSPDGAGASTTMRACPYCGEQILVVARKCKHCSEMVDPALRASVGPQHVQVNVGVQHAPVQYARNQPSPGVAALLSLIWPGAGQIYAGHVGAGIGWMIVTFLGYVFFFVPGLILHVVAVFSAASYARDAGRRIG